MPNEDKTQIWNQPLAPISEILCAIDKEMQNAPDTIEIKATLTGTGAQLFYFVSKLLEISFQEDQETIIKYLIRLGVQQELLKLDKAMHIVDSVEGANGSRN